MKIILTSLILMLLLATGATGQAEMDIRKKIVPLRTDRAGVAGIARRIKESGNSATYETGREVLEITFSGESCLDHGWKVPKGRVVEYRSYPKSELALADVLRTYKGLVATGNDHGWQIYTQRSTGIEFVADSGSSIIDHIRFTPAAADGDLRCAGFPVYDPVTDHYSPYQRIRITDASEWDSGSIYGTIAQVQANPKLSGYIFVYCRKGENRDCRTVKTMVEKVAKIEMKPDDAGRLSVTFGGYRDHLEVEGFLVRKGYPPALPRPLYPSADQPE